MPELGKAYVQIVPSAQGISGSISGALGGEAQSAGASAGNSLGSSLVSTLKGIIVAAGIGSMIKETLSAGGDLQQSFGGLDTIYGDAADAAKSMPLRHRQQVYLQMNMLRMLYHLEHLLSRHSKEIQPKRLKLQTQLSWI